MANFVDHSKEDVGEEASPSPVPDSEEGSPTFPVESGAVERSPNGTSQRSEEDPQPDAEEVVIESIVKKKRGRPAGKKNGSSKKVSSGRGRGRPSGFNPTRAISNGLDDETTGSENQYQIMDERLSFELRGHPAKDLMELTLDNAKSPDANFLRTKNFTSLKYLSMINCGLRSLAGLPALPSLKIVVLNGNRLTGDLSFLSRCDKLQYVDLSENLIGATESLAPLQWLRKLRALYLMSNPVAFVDGYRATVLNIIPSLQDLDGTDPSGKAITQSVLLKERGSEDSEAVSEMPVTSAINCVGVGNTEAMEAVMMLLQGEDPTTDKESAEANTSGLADLRQFLIL